MAAPGETPLPVPNSEAQFASTHWSVIAEAAQTSSPEAQSALEKLCRAYWYPLYAFLRRKGHSPQDAEDLTQEFFARRVVTKRIFEGMQPGVGRFRSWLLTCLQNLVLNERERHQAQKRGGGQSLLSLDFQTAEGRYLAEPADLLTPEKLYERTWAMTLLDNAMRQLREKYEHEGKSPLFEQLKNFLPGEQSNVSHAAVAERLGKSEDAVKMSVSRLRQEYGRALQNEIKRTVNSTAEAQEELRYLLKVLGD